MKRSYILLAAIVLTACQGNQNIQTTDIQDSDTTEYNCTETASASEVTDEKEVIINRVNDIYAHVLKDDYSDEDSYYSSSYKALLAEGNMLAKGGCWGADCDFWTMTQDTGDGSELTNAEILRMAPNKAIVKCNINIRYGDQTTPICCVLEMIKENDVWVADDCMNEDETYSIKQAAIDDINAMKQEVNNK